MQPFSVSLLLACVRANVSCKFKNTSENFSRPCDNTHRPKACFRLPNQLFAIYKRSNAQTAQLALANVAVVLPSLKNARNEVKAAYLDETVTASTSAVVGQASLTTRIRAQDVIDSYQISQARLKGQYPRWSLISSDDSEDSDEGA